VCVLLRMGEDAGVQGGHSQVLGKLVQHVLRVCGMRIVGCKIVNLIRLLVHQNSSSTF